MSITINGSGTVSGLTAAPNLTSSGLTTGKIGKVEHVTNTYNYSTSSTSFVDILSASGTTLEVPITPSATSSKILVSQSLFINALNQSEAENRYGLRLYAKINSGSYTLLENYNYVGQYNYTGGNALLMNSVPLNLAHLHTPSYSAGDTITYKWQIQTYTSNASININNGDKKSTVTLFEVLT